MKNIFPILVVIYILEFIILGIAPFDRATWFAENLPMVLIVLALVLTYRKFQFSNLSYIFMFVLIYLHTIGGHYTFANVPFGFVTDLFWFERNHFDRIAHFSVGFYAYPLAEILVRHYKVQHNFIIYFFPLCFIAAVAGIYEVIEWIYADLSAPEAGLAFLWSQWDIWDAQKDILADTLGAIFSLSIFALFNKKDKQ